MQILTRILSGDGSHSLHHALFDTTFHSIHGAIGESKHVFIEAGLKNVLLRQTPSVRILELGFGTGLNALLSFLVCLEAKVQLSYTAIEISPLDKEIIFGLNYPTQVDHPKAQDLFGKLHDAEWNTKIQISKESSLNKIEANWLEFKPNPEYDLVYLDFFGPTTQPELWDDKSLDKIKISLVPGGCLTTFCAQGEFKRTLKKLGFVVESLPGPAGKREMVRATKPA